MKAYLEILEKVLSQGVLKENRTGVDTLAIAGAMFQHDMAKGFPLLTTKYIPLGLVASELEFFIKGLMDKEWLQKRGNHIWDEWCNPMKVPYGHDEETREKMKKENDLGPVYGAQWRNFDKSHLRDGIDQLKQMVDTLKKDPDCRRNIVSAWNPRQLKQMALVPCHYCFQVTVIDGYLNLFWNQRSVDTGLGLPFNIASYALLLLLLAKEAGLKPGILTGFLADVHVYVNHVKKLREQLTRKRYDLPSLDITCFSSIFDWTYQDFILTDYKHGGPIKLEIAV